MSSWTCPTPQFSSPRTDSVASWDGSESQGRETLTPQTVSGCLRSQPKRLNLQGLRIRPELMFLEGAPGHPTTA